MSKVVAEISMSLDGYVAGPDATLEEPLGKGGEQLHEFSPGGTSFTFVTDGVEAAVERARTAAGDEDVLIAGGGSVIQQCLASGLLDELNLHTTPVLLGGGVRLFEGAAPRGLEIAGMLEGQLATHVRYRVPRV